jgi:hypothetical protein
MSGRTRTVNRPIMHHTGVRSAASYQGVTIVLIGSITLARMDSERTAPGRGSVAPRARSGPFRSLRMILIGADPPPPPARSTWLARALPILGVGTSIATVFIAAANYDDRYARPLLLWPASVLIGLPLALIRRWPLLAWRIAWLTAVIIGAVFRVNRSLPWPWQHIQLLGVLRSGSPDLELAPQPGLADLDGVVDASRRAGVDMRMSWAGVPATVPSVVGLSAYRIVQEALSNASRHAPGAAVTIDLRGGGFALWATLPLSGERSR